MSANSRNTREASSKLATVLQLVKPLLNQPERLAHDDFQLRTFADSADIAAYVRLRQQAFAAEVPCPADWTESTFRRELMSKWWWRSDWVWFALSSAQPELGELGMVTLALRGESGNALPVVHWLSVLPEWRGQGIARLLLNTLECAAWHHGYRELRLETHVGWRNAARFYASAGFIPN